MKKQVLKTIKSNFLHELQDARAGKKREIDIYDIKSPFIPLFWYLTLKILVLK